MLDSYIKRDATRLLPLFWLRGEAEDVIREGVRQVKASGCDALCAESRTHPDYLGEGWWRDLGIILDECKELNMRMWVLDDMMFPSGYAAGKAEGTEACRKMMTEKHMDVMGPQKRGAFMVMDDERTASSGVGLVAVVACKRLDESDRIETFEDIGGYKLGECVDITHTVVDGLAYWDVPDGIWRIFVLTSAYVAERNPPRFFANPLMPEGGKLMIDNIYQPHYDHFCGHFGGTFAGFFSDEPALRAGKGHRAIPGEYPRLPIPWSEDLIGMLKTALGEQVVSMLPGIWFDIGPDTPRIRYALMDAITLLYAENYSQQLGDWCRAHGVEYIGHVIEQNNSHSRLGSGAGHFFRALSGQDMAGIDIVLHEIKPEFRGIGHAWQSQDFEADDDFFRYMLAQMAVSSAYLDPKKKGRTMCEIYGAYGWQEDLAEMRYLSNLMLSRGVNYFSPHAFSLQPYPDSDSPPHFDKVMNPLMPYIRQLFKYLTNAGSIIDGGVPISKVATLYFAEGEWANGQAGSMKTQTIVRTLNERHIECLIVPLDDLESAAFDLLIVPFARTWPRKLFEVCHSLLGKGKKVLFVDAFPENLSQGSGNVNELTAGLSVVPLHSLAKEVLAAVHLPYAIKMANPQVHFFPYRRGDDLVFALMNEDVTTECEFQFFVEDNRAAYQVNVEAMKSWLITSEKRPGGQLISMRLEPGELLFCILTDTELSKKSLERLPLRHQELSVSQWEILLRLAGRDGFEHFCKTGEFINITAPDVLPRFSGTIRYMAQVVLPEGCLGLEITESGNAVHLWLDSKEVGVRFSKPYRFLFDQVTQGQHTLWIDVTNAPVFAHRDPLSFFSYLKPSGIFGSIQALMLSR